MAPQVRLLPLFPLNVVLFPNAPLPLHVFEERYKLMIQRCLDEDARFGVVLIKSGVEVGEPAEPHSIGTVAHIVGVRNLDEGRMLVTTMGERRFRIQEVVEMRPYLRGTVELLDDDSDDALDPETIGRVRRALTVNLRLLIGTRGGWVRAPRMPDDPVTLSYYIAAILQAGPPEKQALLAESSTAARLRAEIDLLEHDVPRLRERVSKELLSRFSMQ